MGLTTKIIIAPFLIELSNNLSFNPLIGDIISSIISYIIVIIPNLSLKNPLKYLSKQRLFDIIYISNKY